MLVLHALWDDGLPGKLHLWAESSELADALSGKGRGRTAQAKNVKRPHLFAVAGAELLAAVSEVAGGLLAEAGTFDALTVQLPSAANAKTPLPSPQLILETPRAEKATGLSAWEIATLSYEPSVAFDLLLALTDQPPLGISYGQALCFWLEAARFGLELTARQRFVPTVLSPVAASKKTAISYRAAWQIQLDPPDRERLRTLAQAMPPLCRAIPSGGQRLSQALSPLGLVESFLNQQVDSFVRQSLETTPMLPRRLRGRANHPLAEQWLHALASTQDAALNAPASELKAFAGEVHNWLNQLQALDSKAPFRTCFRLEPPLEETAAEVDDLPDDWFGQPETAASREQPWRLGFYLQANDDPSLLVEAGQVWQERSGTLTLLKRRFENPQERLLADLGKASRLYPALEESLKTARPAGLALDTAQTYHFLRFVAPLLEQSGFGVLLPSWWSKPAAKLGVKLKVRPKPGDSKTSSGLLGMDSLVQYDWQVALGDRTLSAKEFEKLAKLKVPLVKIRGQWVELKPEEMEAALAFFQKKHLQGDMTLGEALQAGLGDMGEAVGAVGLPVNDLEVEGWIKELMDKLTHNETLNPVVQPRALQGQLRPYQLRGVSWLAFLRQFGFGACLADDMGLGKSIQLIALLLHERERTLPIAESEKALRPTLLVCPMSVVGNWQRELEKFAPSLKVMVHHGAQRLWGEKFEEEARAHDLVLTTYALAQRDEAELARLEWNNVVLDEAQNIKNPSANQTQAIRRIPARSRIALTGTPVENRLAELWSIMHFLNPGYLGSSQEFRTRFATPIEKYHDKGKSDRLKNLIQPFVLRRVKTDKSIIADLPEKLEMKVYCNLTREQATLYEAVVKEMLEQIEQAEGIQRRGLVLSTLMKLKQICNHPAQFVKDNSSLPGRSGKLIRLEEMLEEALAEGDKALIFSQFAEMGAMLRTHLQHTLGREVLFLYGDTPKAQRDYMVQRFQQEGRGGPPLFILSLKAGGVGLNLTAANHVFHFDRWWNPAVENQATDRAFRIGQQKNVQVHKYICVGTLEEKIDLMIEQKKELAQSIVGSGENWITELSTAQLRDLFSLSRDAVGE